MSSYRCPYCRPRPLRLARRADGVAICGWCGDPLERVPLVRPWAAVALLLVTGGLAAATFGVVLPRQRPLPDANQGPLAALAGQVTDLITGPPRPRPEDAPLTAERDASLYGQLDAADKSWRPRAEVLPGGHIRYSYRRRRSDPPLSIEQIKLLMRYPPRFEQERAAVAGLLAALRSRGVLVVLGPPRKPGAAGEWEPRAGLLRIRPDVPGQGSRQFAQVLNHEAIHVAQSCRNGHLRARPMPLGLSRQVDAEAQRHLQEPIYARASPRERALEEEAYANQARLELGIQLLEANCRARTAPAPQL
ncbi:hypothetical protein [Vulcanococcus limneticus]|uniref:hypothetical protein n=1 Tax=Vulcanococcus limneticus TaxID=2170428 RepID=UPI000B998F0E|nr:hypothetical protein [Vulcanococcus limneticus]MCP9791422.1 hypothetical protein [Vulcanococcus limneticus MW73D5]MCP9893421.1 hypothetical protein [Vulcanococcus limneticus Candia 3F8]MCP9896789.1 hypothetical protein [Vulcanococcus limneticus Candia 3B3]